MSKKPERIYYMTEDQIDELTRCVARPLALLLPVFFVLLSIFVFRLLNGGLQ